MAEESLYNQDKSISNGIYPIRVNVKISIENTTEKKENNKAQTTTKKISVPLEIK